MLAMWAIAIAVATGLMGGGVAGLVPVEIDRWSGLPLTLMLSIAGIFLALILSVFLALGRQSNLPVIRWLCIAYIELIRGVPLISILFMAALMLPVILMGCLYSGVTTPTEASTLCIWRRVMARAAMRSLNSESSIRFMLSSSQDWRFAPRRAQ